MSTPTAQCVRDSSRRLRRSLYYPALGRFLQSDPTGFDAGDANLFRYCAGDPINGSDPLGLHDLGDEAEIAAWNEATTEGVVVNGYDLARADALRERWSTFTPLNDYFNRLFSD